MSHFCTPNTSPTPNLQVSLQEEVAVVLAAHSRGPNPFSVPTSPSDSYRNPWLQVPGQVH